MKIFLALTINPAQAFKEIGGSSRYANLDRLQSVFSGRARRNACTYADNSRGNREIPRPPSAAVALGRIAKFKDARQ